MKIEGIAVSGFCIDSRKLQPGECFVAIKTEQADGHDYLEQAKQAGAALALVTQKNPAIDLPQKVVPDTVKALGKLAHEHRLSLPSVKLAALTGSCGKTTTRQFLECICMLEGKTHASIKSYNNHLGVPLTLLGLSQDDQFAVQEMGANHPGEIAYITNMARPNVAMITNAGPVHLEGFKSVNGVAHAKAEIYQGLVDDGTAVINADDNYASLWLSMTEKFNQITFASEHDADVMAKAIHFTDEGLGAFRLCIGDQRREVQLQMLGRHNVMNALAAAAMAHGLGICIDAIAQGLQQARAVERRMRRYPAYAGATLLDDSYNANPKAVMAAIDVLQSLEGERILVLGDMAELGDEAIAFHQRIGAYAKAHDIQHCLSIGAVAAHAAKAFGTGGLAFDDKQALLEALKKILHKQAIVLVKGSFSSGMDVVTQSIREESLC